MKPDLTLRRVTMADLPRLFEHQSDPVSVRMAAFPSRDLETFTAHWAKNLVDPSAITRAIIFEGEVAGYVVIFGPAHERLVGYWLGREFWGKGLATRALAAMLDEISERPLFARVAKHNAGSIRVLEKCGFTVVGEDKSAFGDEGEIVEDWIMKR